jgi:hypothetical protein
MTEQKKKRKPTKIYYIQYQTQEKGELDAFPSRRAAEKAKADIHREQRQAQKEYDAKTVHEWGDSLPYERLPDSVESLELPITKAGLVLALSLGADFVWK